MQSGPTEPAQGPTTLTQPVWTTKTFWTSLIGIVTAGGAIIALLTHDQKWAVGAASFAALLGNLGSMFARQGGTQAALEVGDRAGVLLPAEKEVKKP
jgi:hypothetical protein